MNEKQLKIWLTSYITIGFAFMFIEGFMPFEFDWVIKAIPLFLLMYFCYKSLKGALRNVMLLALVCSVTGDILLSLNDLFIQGLAAFLLAQLVYTGIFLSQFTFSRSGAAWMGFVIVYLAFASGFILPKAGDFTLPVLAYMFAIGLMAISAGFRKDPHFLFVALGAMVFVISDTTIAINKFVMPVDGGRYIIMTTYYGAQLMICMGMVRHFNLNKLKS